MEHDEATDSGERAAKNESVPGPIEARRPVMELQKQVDHLSETLGRVSEDLEAASEDISAH